MVKTKELIICVISIIALILTITSSAFATDGTPDLNALLGNTTTSMGDDKIQSFNSKFTMYEGESRKGSEIKNLFSAVEASNIVDAEHKVTLSGVSEENIELTKEYTVSLQKDTAGYVNQITIKENTEFQVIGGTNNTTNTTNTNSANNTTNSMPDTGVSYASLVIIAIAALSAVYAYKKIKEYNV